MIGFWQRGLKCGAAIAVLSTALLGCSNTESLSPQAKIETQAEVLKPTAAEEFTTKDKPTKTIETPWGPREVYDPTQDKKVMSSFLRLYNIGDEIVEKQRGSTLSNDAEIVYAAREKKFKSLLENGCAFITSNQCGSYWSLDDEILTSCLEKEQTNCILQSAKFIQTSQCSIRIPDVSTPSVALTKDLGRPRFSTFDAPISSSPFIELIAPSAMASDQPWHAWKKLTVNEVSAWYFFAECKWQSDAIIRANPDFNNKLK